MPGNGGLWRRGELEQSREIEPAPDLGRRVDRLDRAFQSELTSSMSLNVRGTAVGAASSIAILLLAEFSTTWLDDSRWKLEPEIWDIAMKVLLPVAVVTLALCILLSVVAVWPKRRWANEQKERIQCLNSGATQQEAVLLLAMVEHQRRANERRSRLIRLAAFPLFIALTAVSAQCLIFAFVADPEDPARAGEAEEVPIDDGTGLPSAEDQARLAGVYAPLVYLHRSERYGPIDPTEFLEGSKLVWRKRRGSTTIAKRGTVEAPRLGRGCDRAPGGCYRFGDFLARELTRPFQNSRQRAKGLNERRGFALEPNERARLGQAGRDPDVPMLWEFRRAGNRLLITYWFYYGYSRPNDPRAEAVSDLSSHDGDWENVDVALEADASKPVGVFFYGHGAPSYRPWTSVCKVGPPGDDCSSELPGHPVVYSALSSHASYPVAGSFEVHGDAGTATDVTAAGWRWESWDRPGGLRPVKAEGWYGFGGAWGRAKQIPGTTGPLGPSRWKLPADPDPGDLASRPGP